MIPENTHQNFCEYADKLVSYLYDEISQSEKSLFESHLAGCGTCTDELADFLIARSSIIEWRDAEFRPLATPYIELPANKVELVNNDSDSSSLLARIRALLSLSPAWTGAAVAAALVICVGLSLLVLNLYKRGENIARVEEKSMSVEVSPPKKEEVAELNADNSDKQNESVSKESSKPPIIKVEKTEDKKENSPIKVSQPERVKNKNVDVERAVKPNRRVIKKSNQSPPPTLLADEDESKDDSLRLSDLFKEVGS